METNAVSTNELLNILFESNPGGIVYFSPPVFRKLHQQLGGSEHDLRDRVEKQLRHLSQQPNFQNQDGLTVSHDGYSFYVMKANATPTLESGF